MTPSVGTSSGQMNAPVRYRGVPFEFGDRIIIIAPLPLDDVQEASEKLQPTPEEVAALANKSAEVIPTTVTPEQKAKNRERFVIMRDTICKAVRRNHTEFTDADAKDFVTMANVTPAFNAAMYGQGKAQLRGLPGETLPDWTK